jgi:hypothetical protein
MRQTKYLVTGALLLALGLTGFVNLACDLLFPAEDVKYEIPSYYTTYTDESQLFSISYPYYWRTPLGNVAEFQEYMKKSAGNLKTGIPLQNTSLLFFAGVDTTRGYDPLIVVAVEPAAAGVLTQRQMIETELKRVKLEDPDFQVLSRVDTKVNGREATVLTWKEAGTRQGNLYVLEMLTLVDQNIWIVAGVTADATSKWDVDFNTIVRSLQIHK